LLQNKKDLNMNQAPEIVSQKRWHSRSNKLCLGPALIIRN